MDQWWPNIKNAGLEVLWYPGVTSIAKEPYNCLILQGGPDPCPLPPSLPSNYQELTCFWSIMSQHIRFWIHFVHVTFTSTKNKASPFIFKRIFVSMPIHLLVSFLLFIMSFYRGGGTGSKDLWHFDRVSAYFSDASQIFPMHKKSLLFFWIGRIMYEEQIKVIIRQADPYDKTGDATKGGRGCKIWLHQNI